MSKLGTVGSSDDEATFFFMAVNNPMIRNVWSEKEDESHSRKVKRLVVYIEFWVKNYLQCYVSGVYSTKDPFFPSLEGM